MAVSVNRPPRTISRTRPGPRRAWVARRGATDGGTAAPLAALPTCRSALGPVAGVAVDTISAGGMSGLQVAQDGQDPAVVGLGRSQVELGEDRGHVLLDGAGADHELGG